MFEPLSRPVQGERSREDVVACLRQAGRHVDLNISHATAVSAGHELILWTGTNLTKTVGGLSRPYVTLSGSGGKDVTGWPLLRKPREVHKDSTLVHGQSATGHSGPSSQDDQV